MIKTFKKIFLIIVIITALVSSYKLIVAEDNLQTFHETTNESPIVITKPIKSNEELVFIAHGFAGSSSFMRSIAVSLAKSGYTTIRFDFLGHGKHSLPYSGSITSLRGATSLFINQTNDIVDYYLKKYDKKSAVIIGHSMATDIIVRTALKRDDINAVIGISTYTDAIQNDTPRNVLILNGEWESKLRNKALEILRQSNIKDPLEDVLYGSFYDGTSRKTVAIKNSDHVRILYSEQTQKEINDWISKTTNKNIEPNVNNIGLWTIVLISSLFFLFIIIIDYIPNKRKIKINIPVIHIFSVNLVAAFLTPILLKTSTFEIINIPTHNYLINHLLLYSFFLMILIPNKIYRNILSTFNAYIFLIVIIFYTLIIGGVIDSYISSFYPSSIRINLIAWTMLGCLPLMVIIQIFNDNQKNNLIMRNITNFFLVLSLSTAIYFNFEELFLLGYAIFLFIAFTLFFGFLSNVLNKKYGNLLSIGLVNGVTLSWTFAIALPIYIP